MPHSCSILTTVIKRLLLILPIVFLLLGCQAAPIQNIEIPDQTFTFELFTPGAIQTTYLYEDGTLERVPFERSWLRVRDVEKLSRPGRHSMQISHAGLQTSFTLTLEADALNMQLSNIYTLGSENNQIDTDYDTWKESIAGDDGRGVRELFINAFGELVVTYSDDTQANLGQITGDDAPLIELAVDGDLLTWNYVDESDREVLFDLSALKGDTGTSIDDLSFNNSDELIVTFDDGTANNLGSFSAFLDTLAIDTIYTNSRSELIIVLTDGRSFNVGSVIGPVGPRGETGPRGIQGPRGFTGERGPAGEAPEFRIDGVMMQYKYPSEASSQWRDLFNFQTLESETFTFVTSPGVVLQTSNDTLQWKLDEDPDSSFQTLFTSDELSGPAGPTGPAGRDGVDGADGAQLEIRYNAELEQIETKYTDESSWSLLTPNSTFQGPRGYDLTLSTSGNAIVWGVSDGAVEFQPLVDFEALKAPPAEIIVSGEAIYSRGLNTDAYTFVISLSALEGPIGPEGRGISAVAINGSNEFTITYTDNSSDNLGTLADLLTVSFRHPDGFLYDTQIVASGSNLTTPTAIPSIAYATLAGFNASLTNITESKIIETIFTYETLTIDFTENITSITLTAQDALTLPTPSSIEGYTFTGFIRRINGAAVPAYDGMPISQLFIDQRTITLSPTYAVTERFDVRNEEARIRMINEVLDGVITVVNQRSSGGTALGSGVVVSRTALETGYRYWAVSNYHVIESNAQVDVRFYRGGNLYDETAITVKGYSEVNDVSVLEFDSEHLLTPVAFGNSFDIDTGQTVYALGNPVSFNYFHTTTEGLLVSDKRLFDNIDNINSFFIQHSALINPGNSGGPIVDSNGHLLGLNTIRAESTSGDSPRDVVGIAFAIPSLIVERVYLDVVESRSDTSRKSFGITAESDPYSCTTTVLVGVCINGVSTGSYAEELGLATGDIIIQFKNDRLATYVDVDNANELKEAMYMTQVNGGISVVYLDASNSYTTVETSRIILD